MKYLYDFKKKGGGFKFVVYLFNSVIYKQIWKTLSLFETVNFPYDPIQISKIYFLITLRVEN